MTAPASGPVEFRPQPGPQERFLATPADIAIMGGSVFGGKTWALLYDPLRHVRTPGFTFAVFRRITQEHRNPGGTWDEALNMYPYAGGVPRADRLEWTFPRSKAHGRFAHLQYDTDVLAWKGSQVCAILFDQLEEFTEYQFWYLYSRNRSTCGVRPYIRASCNPAPNSWLAKFLEWWIDQETGYAIPERSGKVRWFIRDGGEVHWADDPSELAVKFGARKAKYARSVTFILARLQDNKIGNLKDPDYEAKVRALPYVEQERLLGGDRGGNWLIVAAAGNVFPAGSLKIRPVPPVAVEARVRYWDRAAGDKKKSDWTVGVLMAAELLRIGSDGKPVYRYIVEDVARFKEAVGKRDDLVAKTVASDMELDPPPHQGTEQEPGAGGKEAAEVFVWTHSGATTFTVPSTKSKLERAGALASQAQHGNVDVLKRDWTPAFVNELQQFPDGVWDDQVDGASGAYNRLQLILRHRWRPGDYPSVKR